MRKRGAGYAVRPLLTKRKHIIVLTDRPNRQAVRALEAISAPENAHLFTREAALAAFADI